MTAPLRAVALAVMVVTQPVVGQPTEVASPVTLIVATLAVLDCQATSFVKISVVGLALNVPTAMNCTVSPRVFSV
jgi:hypothetical protein